MKNKLITKRDFKFFILGILFSLVLGLIFNWTDFKKGFDEGFNAGHSLSTKP